MRISSFLENVLQSAYIKQPAVELIQPTRRNQKYTRLISWQRITGNIFQTNEEKSLTSVYTVNNGNRQDYNILQFEKLSEKINARATAICSNNLLPSREGKGNLPRRMRIWAHFSVRHFDPLVKVFLSK